MTEQIADMTSVLLNEFNAHYIPLEENGKIPIARFKDKPRMTPDELATEYNRKSNFALLCKPNLFFIDLDTAEAHNGRDGLSTFTAWLKANKIDPDSILNNVTLMGRTSSGGIHIVFLQPDVNNLIGQRLDFLGNHCGIDLKGSTNNYIVCEPSIVDGKPYQWTNRVKPIMIPRDLEIAIRKYRKEKDKSRQKNVTETTYELDGLRYNKAYTARPHVDVFYTINNGWGDVGTRNNNVFLWAQEMRITTTIDMALAYAEIANQNSDDPMDEDEVIRTVESAYEFKYDDTRQPTITGHAYVARMTFKNQEYMKFLGEYDKLNVGVLRDVFMAQHCDYDPTHYDKSDLVFLMPPTQVVRDDIVGKHAEFVQGIYYAGTQIPLNS